MASYKRPQSLLVPHLGNPKVLAAMQEAINGGFADQGLSEPALKRDISQLVREITARQSSPLSRVRLLFDKNIYSQPLIAAFANAGFKVKRLYEVGLNDSATDTAIVQRAIKKNCIVMTFDRDFERIYRAMLIAGDDLPGIILLPATQGYVSRDPDKNPMMAQVVAAVESAAQNNPDLFKGQLIEIMDQFPGELTLMDIRDPEKPMPVRRHFLPLELQRGSVYPSIPS